MDEDGFSDVADVTDEGYDFAPDPSNVGMDSSDGNNSEELNSFVENLTQKQAYTTGRGASATNPYPESFFSQMFGAENVNYTNIIGSDRINEINDLRYNQAIGGMSNRTGSNTGKQYQAGDYYIGQDTNMGTVKSIEKPGGIMDLMPGSQFIKMMVPEKGLPEFDPRYQEIMNERAKSANDPTIFDRVSDYVKEVTGFGPKDSGNSLSIPVEGQEQVKRADVEYDSFGNIINPAFRNPKVSVSGIDSLNTYGFPRNPRLTDRAFSPSDVNKGPVGSNFPTSAPGRLSPEAMKTAREQYSIPMGQTVERDPSYEGYFSDTAFSPSLTASQNRINESSVYPYEQYADMSSTFRDIGSAAQQAIGADGYPVFDNPNLRLNLGIDRETQEPQGKLTYSTNFFG